MTGPMPLSPHDQTLLDHVRPRDWTPPTPPDRYDLLVLGGGTGGLVSAAIGAALGARTALVERARLGGDCLNHGCVPSKALLRAARAWADARNAAGHFHGPTVTGGGDFPAVMERMRRLRAGIAHVDSAERFRSLGVDVFFGGGRFVAPDALEVEGTRLSFRRCILATGARPAVPPIPGLRDARPLTNETVFDLRELPPTLIVLGAGPIGCELALAFSRFGSAVTLIDRSPRPLPREEPAASEYALGALQDAGVDFRGGQPAARVEAQGPVEPVAPAGPGAKGDRSASGVRVFVGHDGGSESAFEAERLLVALGRTPNLDPSLEAAGVQTRSGGVVVDEQLRTTNPRIFAVGDVTGRHQFTHVADAHARLATRNALFPGRAKVGDLVVPWATYLDPEIARVGASAAELEEGGVPFETVRIDFDHVDRAILESASGFVMVHLKKGDDTILGATVVAPNAGDLISQLTQAMTLGTGLQRLGDVIFPYPTLAESMRKAADARRRARLTPRTEKILRGFFALWRRFA